MQDIWYGDNRDLVKWGTLVHLATREHLGLIVQVALFRKGKPITLKTGLETVPVPANVWSHFRKLGNIQSLCESPGPEMLVFADEFDHNTRRSYFQRVAEVLRQRNEAKAVLLDPDTGLKLTKYNAKHVIPPDILETWEALRKGDWLLLYQHRWFSTRWRVIARQRFKTACGALKVETFRATKQPSDVILLGARK